jgi:small redox-active disulfide protein 2
MERGRYTMKVEVFGTGCAKCHLLEKHVQEAIREAGVQAEVVKVDDIAEIMKRGIIFTPGLAIDGEMKVSGRVPSVKEIKVLITAGAK